MRRQEFHASEALGKRLFSELEVIQVAGIGTEGQPVLKSLNGVVDEGWICFHGSPAGEKTSLVGRPVVASVEETVTRLPSYFMDPQKACPATTLYRSAQAHGVLQAIEEPVRKARVLQRLMEKLQPEGGYVPLDHDSPLYRAQVKGLLIAGLPLDGLTTKAKLAQNRTPDQREMLLGKLWGRGGVGDARAIELIREANPQTPVPAFLAAPEGTTLHAWLPPEDASAAAEVLSKEYWNDVFTREELVRAHLGSTAWVGVKDDAGVLIGTARALADGGKYAWVYDVCVRTDWRGRGLGKVLMRLLLDHPAVRRCSVVRLGTRDAQSLYEGFGFVPLTSLPPRPYATTEMLLRRASSNQVGPSPGLPTDLSPLHRPR
ncbi:MAG: GNAT family N-acetyltransferase [Archangium sp.]|nr:GNAT family N-acetyltransferase [Archangium sp.]MDP3575651.1 GNAT family N-acetyltransferase [Archangium sp.]